MDDSCINTNKEYNSDDSYMSVNKRSMDDTTTLVNFLKTYKEKSKYNFFNENKNYFA